MTVTITCDRCGEKATATTRSVGDAPAWNLLLPSEPETLSERLFVDWWVREGREERLLMLLNTALESTHKTMLAVFCNDKDGDRFEQLALVGPLLCHKCRSSYRKWFGECKAASMDVCGLPDESRSSGRRQER